MTAESFLKRDIEYLEIVIGFCDVLRSDNITIKTLQPSCPMHE